MNDQNWNRRKLTDDQWIEAITNAPGNRDQDVKNYVDAHYKGVSVNISTVNKNWTRLSRQNGFAGDRAKYAAKLRSESLDRMKNKYVDDDAIEFTTDVKLTLVRTNAFMGSRVANGLQQNCPDGFVTLFADDNYVLLISEDSASQERLRAYLKGRNIVDREVM